MRKSLMERAPGNQIDLILTHPRHQWSLRTMIELIRDLRRCETHADLHEFQEQLFGLILDADERRGAVSRVIKRLAKPAGTVPADAPALGTNLDRADIESWRLEEKVHERVARQLRSIGDAMAWRAFHYDRRIIVALSRGAQAGPINRKAGLRREREFITTSWARDGRFVLHHDLTSILRIGDVTVFDEDGGASLYEIKTNEKARIRRQDTILLGTQGALVEGGVLPSGFEPRVSNVSYQTKLAGLRDVLGLAHHRTGIQGGIISAGRAVIAADQYTAAHHYGAGDFGDRVRTQLDRYRRRIGAAPPKLMLTVWSLDQVARSPTRPPWAIYPVAPDVAASLIADAIFFCVLMSADSITSALAEAGVAARWLQSLEGPVDMQKPLIAVAAAARSAGTVKVGWSSLNPEAIHSLMLEFVDLGAWSQQVAQTLTHDVAADVRPWPCFRDEGRTWC